MAPDSATTISVIDFRRRSMVLQWHALGGTWTAYDIPPALVHGIALIRAAQPNICVYGQAGRLRLQVGPDQYALSENSPRISCTRGLASFGFRRRFTVSSSTGGVLYNYAYWTSQRHDFFRWLAAKAEDPDWRVTSGRRWSEGVPATALRSS
ncbi:MAG TPA: hypothetical protein VNZ53_34265 [Steroidobacteraceae bacterium]|nr:hypothetical protein [Steroidobacteraceae bacterium]